MEELGSVDTDALVARCCKVVPVRNSPESAVRIDVLEPSFEKRLSALQRDIVHRISANPELRHRSSVEWFLDNFYLISETTLALRQELPVRFYGQLPAVSTDTGSQQPRIYVLAVEFLAHQFSTLARAPQRASFENFLDEFQQRVPLTIGELWAFPAILRAVCLERIVGLVSEVSRASSDAAIDNESDVALSVQTLISLKAMPWTEVFENASLVHRELARNPAGSYARSDFATRDSYRNVVEELAAHAECDEVAVAERANAVATSGHGPTFDRTRDVGYYLLDRGQQELKSALGIKPSLGTRCRRFIRRSATPIYLTSIATATLAILVPLALYLESLSGSGMSIALFCSIAIIPTSAFAVAWVQWLITPS